MTQQHRATAMLAIFDAIILLLHLHHTRVFVAHLCVSTLQPNCGSVRNVMLLEHWLTSIPTFVLPWQSVD